MKWFAAGISVFALAAGGALAQPGNGNGNGGGNGGGGPPAMASSSNGQGGGNRNGNGNGNANRGNGGGMAASASQTRGNGNGNGNGGGNGMANANAGNRPSGNADISRGNGGIGNGNGNGNRGNDNANGQGRGNGAAIASRNVNRGSALRDLPGRYLAIEDYDARRQAVGLIDGCPPGLAQKYNGCRPPGQAKKDGFLRRDAYDLDWWGLPRMESLRYRYDSGYLLGLDPGGLISAYIPLLGGALSVGNVWPQSYGYSRLSPYYTDYYQLGPRDSYRYADNVVYRLDPETAAITSVAALLTGDDFSVGQPVPRGYDIYNVPPAYRDRYYDRPDAHYRYSDGYIYQIDPETRLVTAAIEMLLN